MPSPTPQCCSYGKGSFWVALDYSCQLIIYIYIYILTCTCISFHPGRVKPASSQASTAYRCLCCSLKKILWNLIEGRVPSPTRRNALFAADFPQTHWQSDPRPLVARIDFSWIFTRYIYIGYKNVNKRMLLLLLHKKNTLKIPVANVVHLLAEWSET